jgi:hypothetical protein
MGESDLASSQLNLRYGLGGRTSMPIGYNNMEDSCVRPITQLLSELTARSTLTPSDIEFAIHKIGQVGETMTQSGIAMGPALENYVKA